MFAWSKTFAATADIFPLKEEEDFLAILKSYFLV